jgi:hypothetical protein
MSFKQISMKAVLAAALMATTAGVLPAPMCPDSRTPGQFSAYMTSLNSQPGVFTQIWNYIVALF